MFQPTFCALFRLKTGVFKTDFYLTMSFLLIDRKPLQEPFHLADADFLYVGILLRPLEFHLLKEFLACQNKSVFIITENLDRISAFIAEDKSTTFREWVHSELKIHHRNKTLGLFSEIRGTDCQKYMFRITGETAQHNFCSFTSNSAARLTEWLSVTWIHNSFHWISIVPDRGPLSPAGSTGTSTNRDTCELLVSRFASFRFQ